MAKTLQQILGFENLTGVVQAPEGGVPADILAPEFLSTTRNVFGNTATITETAGQRKTSKLIQYGAPSHQVSHQDRSTRPTILMHTYEHIIHAPLVINQIRDFSNQARQQQGMDELAQQTAAFRARFNNLRVSAVWSMLRHGAIYFDADGDLLPNSTNVVTTVDFAVPANNKNQLNSIIAASWATAGTSIVTQLENLKIQARKVSGRPITDAFYGTKILQYFLGNTEIKEILKADSGLAASFRRREIPPGFLGINWHPAYEAFFEDADGTNQSWFGDDRVTFTPAVDRSWYELVQGSFSVPTRVSIAATAVETLTSFREVAGMFSYAQITDDPPGIKHYAGDTFLPTIRDPNAIFIADVTP